jgi:flagellar L-ring protein precursor FlgH
MNIRYFISAGVFCCLSLPQGAFAQESAQSSQNTNESNSAVEQSAEQPAQRRRLSWLSDRRELQVGDIVTVYVEEVTLASLDKRVDATDNRRRDLNASVSAPSSRQGLGVATSNNAVSQSRGTDARTNRVATEMSARVVEVDKNGQVRLEGSKTLNVEKSKIHLALSGWARTQDITSNNIITSSRLADARLTYQAEGPLGSPKGGIISRLLGRVWP